MSNPVGIARRRFLWPEGANPCPLDRALRETLAGASWTFCRRLVETGKVAINGERTVDLRAIVQSSDEITINPNAARTGSPDASWVRLVHYDSQIAVAEKPSGISTVPFDSREQGTFDELVRRALGRNSNQRLPPLGIVHRIDKETSGLLVFARTLAAKRHLKQQFRFHTNHRAYLAIATGSVAGGTITTRLVADRGDGRRGSTRHTGLGQLATTHVEVVERFAHATLIRCRLETGRTHQIRIQLAESGHPLLGERVYGPVVTAGRSATPRLMLHAAELSITHPTQDVRLSFHSEPPDDFLSVIRELKARG